jgi:hypothetical protein
MSGYGKRNIFILLIMISVSAFGVPAYGADAAGPPGTSARAPSHYFTATYFHNTFRCPTCRRIEALSAEAIHQNFSTELKNKTLIWRVINLDEPQNKHYIADYQLYTKSLVIAEVKDGKEIRWKNLDKVWNLVRDQKAFEGYVASEIRTWMGN